MKTQVARREFLRIASRSAGFAAVGSTFFDGILGQLLQKAYAQSLGITDTKSACYVHLSLSGGPPRWMFDLPLTPGGKTDKNFVAGNFGTLLETVAGKVKPVYEVEKFSVGGRSLYLPPVWGMDLKGQKFTDLLPETLFVRGMDMEINNHGLSNQRQVAPIIGGTSLSGAVADTSSLPVPTIADTSTPASNVFRSKKALALTSISYTESSTVNPVQSILKPFTEFRAGRAAHGVDREKLREQALKQFESYAQKNGVTSSALPQMYDKAMQLIDDDVIALSDQWAATVKKYRDIITEALHPLKGSLPGIYDKAIAGGTANEFSFNREETNRVTLADVRDTIGADTRITRMAENFTVAEILSGRVSSSFTLNFPGIERAVHATGTYTVTHDQHFIGSIISTMTTTLFYRAFLGCLVEFVRALKEKQLYDRTLIHIASEFNRTPRTDGRGSDHGYTASNTTLISGMINGGTVIGNIKTTGSGTTYGGSFGVAADYTHGGLTRPIQVNDVALTVSSMLALDNIVTNGRSLLKPDGTKWSVQKEEANNG